MKKNKYTYYLQKTAVALLCLTALSSCQFEELAEDNCQEKGLIVVNLGINGLSTRAAGDPLFIGDEQITKIRIFVFTGDVLEVNKLFISGENQFDNPFVLEVTTGTKDIYVVANETSELSTQLASVTTKNGLNWIMSKTISAPLSMPLVMTGSKTGVSVDLVEEPNRNAANVILTRVAARISLMFKKDTNADVKITKVLLLTNTGATTIWDIGILNNGVNNWNWNHNLSAPLTLQATASGIKGQENIYLYENLTSGDKTKATQLEVEALYNGVPTKYSVYINENITLTGSGVAGESNSSETNPSDHLYSIKRNHHYQLNGTIIDIGEYDGLTLTTNVLPWNVLPSSISFERIFTISPTPTQQNKIFTVDSNREVKFTFKLTSPIDASWVANLTDIANFELVGTSQGKTDDEIVITIKAKNSAGTESRTTEFYINAEYGGNWIEIPLLSGSDLIGLGNRVVISQPAK